VIVALAIGQVVGTKNIDPKEAHVGQSHRADHMLRDAGFRPDPQTEIVLVRSQSLSVYDPAFRSVVSDVFRSVAPFATIENLRSPYQPGHADQISADGHSAMVEWEMKGDSKVATKHIDKLTAATTAVAKRHRGFFVGEAGSISSGKALNDAFTSQLAKAGERSIPLTLVVLLLVFGAIVAASVPLLLALSAVAGAIGLVALPPFVDGGRVAVEWWTTMVDEGEAVTLPGCLLLHFEADGRCSDLREYWHLEPGTYEPFAGWGA
jgi:hypothetical protein